MYKKYTYYLRFMYSKSRACGFRGENSKKNPWSTRYNLSTIYDHLGRETGARPFPRTTNLSHNFSVYETAATDRLKYGAHVLRSVYIVCKRKSRV